jgi:plastocyanin
VILTRRALMRVGGGFAAALVAGRGAGAAAPATAEKVLHGNANGSHVWFDPIGLLVEPGTTIRWVNRDPGNAHTATAYHPDVMERPRRMPKDAKPWDSDYLLPDEKFSVRLDVPGVYDFYCIPHEHAGMVGRIVVGEPGAGDWTGSGPGIGGKLPLPEAALAAFPAVEEIMRRKMIRRS